MEPYWDLAEKLDIPGWNSHRDRPSWSDLSRCQRVSSSAAQRTYTGRGTGSSPSTQGVHHARWLSDARRSASPHVRAPARVRRDWRLLSTLSHAAHSIDSWKESSEAGYGRRVMFGTDHMVWPGTIERSIRVVEEAPFSERRAEEGHLLQQRGEVPAAERYRDRSSPRNVILWPSTLGRLMPALMVRRFPSSGQRRLLPNYRHRVR